MVILLRHTGHVSIAATRFAQDSQKRACPQGTNVNPSRGATKQTLHVVSASASAAAVCGAVDVVAAVDCLSTPSSSLSLSAGCKAAVWAPPCSGWRQAGTAGSRIRPVVELGQTGLDSWLVHDVSFAFWTAYVQSAISVLLPAHAHIRPSLSSPAMSSPAISASK